MPSVQSPCRPHLVLQVLLGLAFVAYCGGLAEQNMGTQRLLILCAISTVTSTLFMTVWRIQTYLAAREEDALYSELHGSAGLAMALAVAAVQASPDGSVPRLQAIQHRVRIPG